MRYSQRLVQQVTGEAPAHTSPVGWAGTQKRNDTLLWGQSETFTNPILDSGAPEVFTFGEQQLVKVFYERPTSWTLKAVATAQRPAGETATFTIFFDLMIGVGQTRLTVRRSHDFTTPAPGTVEIFEFPTEQLPAQGVQVAGNAIVGAGGVIVAGSHVGTLTVLIAPVFE